MLLDGTIPEGNPDQKAKKQAKAQKNLKPYLDYLDIIIGRFIIILEGLRLTLV